MENLSNINTIKKVLEKHGFNFSKSLGQNFITNPSICPNMAENCTSNSKSAILEIGPGIGVLTVELAKRFSKVISVEIDKKLIPILNETTAEFNNIKFINDDILNINLKELWKTEFNEFSEVNICANLPYYITSDIIMYILENNPGFKSLTVMVQKEAAQRICALPGTRKSGAISLAVRYYGTPEILFEVSKGSFIPSPKVDSSVIKINMNDSVSQNIKNKTMFFKVVKAAYSERRKNLLNSLSHGLKIPKDKIKSILDSVNISSSLRAEQLNLEDFINISEKLN